MPVTALTTHQDGDLISSLAENARLTPCALCPTIRAYGYELSCALLDVLEERPGVTVYGITDTHRLEERVPPMPLR